MLKVAITGNIASGKSCAEEYIKSSGYFVADTDKINASLLKQKSVVDEIINAFREFDVIDEAGGISKEKLGKIVFSFPEKKILLENIMHKKIFSEINKIFETNKGEKFIFISVPLLFESDADKMFDKIIFISAPEELRINRLMSRNGYDREYALKRIKSQDCEEEKIPKCDYVINNTGDKENLFFQIEQVLKSLKKN